MGHYLHTVNPQAAEAIQPQPDMPPPPVVGMVLKYFPRPGEGRGGRTEYAVSVTRVYEDGCVDGVVIYDAMDFRDVQRIPPRSAATPWPAWEYLNVAPGVQEPTFILAGRGPEPEPAPTAAPAVLYGDLGGLTTKVEDAIQRIEDRLNKLETRKVVKTKKRKYTRHNVGPELA